MIRVGLVCPYSLDAPGGVQNHVLGLAEWLRAAGHRAAVLAPGRDGPGVTGAGPALPVPANGSVARLALGPGAAGRARAWLARGGFDLVHLHEPANPSLCLPVLRAGGAGRVPVVATFHAAAEGSGPVRLARLLLGGPLGRLDGRIAVSEQARRTAAEQGPSPEVVPNGLDTGFFAAAEPRPAWLGSAARPTVAVIGRLREPRKGLPVLVRAAAQVRARRPGVRFLLLGRGPTPSRPGLEPLGPLGEADKAALLRSVDLFVAPHTGGESFGIVLAEAMAAGTPVVASDLPAFRDLLGGGRLGRLFPAGDAAALGTALLDLLADPGARARYREAAAGAVRQYDWDQVGPRVLAVYRRALRPVGA